MGTIEEDEEFKYRKFADINERCRRAFFVSVSFEWEKLAGRPPNAEELRGLLSRYLGDPLPEAPGEMSEHERLYERRMRRLFDPR